MRHFPVFLLFVFLVTTTLACATQARADNSGSTPAASAGQNAPKADAKSDWTGWVDWSLLEGFDAGIGGTLTSSEYKGESTGGTFVPMLSYEKKHFYLRGVAAGVHLFKNDWLELNVQVSYLSQSFSPDGNDKWVMRRLDKRYPTMLAGFNTRMLSPYGVVTFTASTDVLGYNNGVILDANYSLPLVFGPLTLIPTVGTQWMDANYNDYYYGISASEARKSGLNRYEAGSSFTPYGQMMAKYSFSEHWSALGTFRMIFLDKEVSDSPMVEQSEKCSVGLGLMYRF